MKKAAFLTREQAEEIAAKYPTPFHIYDEKGIRENIERVNRAFSWNPGFREYFAVKATPNPYLMKIFRECGCGFDCSSSTELTLAGAVGASGQEIMFSSNETLDSEFKAAGDLGAIINLDDITLIPYAEEALGGRLPATMCCRFNPGGVFTMSNGIMDNPGESKYGMTREQISEAFRILKSKGVEHFGIHAFLASNTVTNGYYPQLAEQLSPSRGPLGMRQGCILPLSISREAWEFPTDPRRSRTTSRSSVPE